MHLVAESHGLRPALVAIWKNERSGWQCKIWLHGLLTSAGQSIFFDCSSALHHHPANLSPYFSSPFLKKMESFEGAVGIDLGTTYS